MGSFSSKPASVPERVLPVEVVKHCSQPPSIVQVSVVASRQSQPLDSWARRAGLHPTQGKGWGDAYWEVRLADCISDHSFAPRLIGIDEPDGEIREECSMCLLTYPPWGINLSKCCSAKMCSECFTFAQTAEHTNACPYCRADGFHVHCGMPPTPLLELVAAGSYKGKPRDVLQTLQQSSRGRGRSSISSSLCDDPLAATDALHDAPSPPGAADASRGCLPERYVRAHLPLASAHDREEIQREVEAQEAVAQVLIESATHPQVLAARRARARTASSSAVSGSGSAAIRAAPPHRRHERAASSAAILQSAGAAGPTGAPASAVSASAPATHGARPSVASLLQRLSRLMASTESSGSGGGGSDTGNDSGGGASTTQAARNRSGSAQAAAGQAEIAESFVSGVAASAGTDEVATSSGAPRSIANPLAPLAVPHNSSTRERSLSTGQSR